MHDSPLTRRMVALVGLTGLGLGIFASSGSGRQVVHHGPIIRVDFNRDIRPVLDKCLSCHGHDPKAIQAGLRLDSFTGATKRLSDGLFAIVPGRPEKSELLNRVNAKDKSMLMPPPSSHRVLSADEKAILRTWIQQGARYKAHWAFVKPVRPAVPRVADTAWPANPIDNFVLARLDEMGLKPSREADKPTLLRRVSLDLTGLPPTPAELDAFLRDRSPKAYERVVDRLLASPRYGERMAMEWLDCARYADSNGYQNDYERFQYRWRDWVIDAFNKNMPYDQFTIDQLAGDLLPNPTNDQIVATGFCRNNRLNSEGGAIPEEYHVEYVIDRVQTMSAVWLGLTTGCARCHDHKYDPISQKEFYSLCSYFNNVPETDIGEERAVNYPPIVQDPYPKQAAEMKRLTAQTLSLRNGIEAAVLAHRNEAQTWQLDPSEAEITDGRVARAIDSVHTDDKSFVNLGPVGDFEWNRPFSYGALIRREGDTGSPLGRMDDGKEYRGWDLHVIDGKPAVHIIHAWPQNAIKVVAVDPIPKGEWVHVFATYDGSGKAKGVQLYVNGLPVQYRVEADTLSDSIRTQVDTHIGRRNVGAVFSGDVDGPVLYDRALSAQEVKKLSDASSAQKLLAVPLDRRTLAQKDAVTRAWLETRDGAFKARVADLERLEAQKTKLDALIPTVMVMKEMPKPRDQFVLIRGVYDHHGAKVTASTPAFLPPVPSGVANNRLALAKWIVSADNPLTARVTVNRMWERLFGVGIVETSEDFGTRSSFPSHPELLDWLATELIAKKWDMKAMWREMVLSSTYRQSSDISPKLLAMDPANRLLARGPRFRLPAEVIRDQAMFAGGFLTDQIGGPSVYPYQPKGIWDEIAGLNGNLRNYKHAIGPGLHRRSLYTIWKRTAPPPDMVLFDAPSREICSVRRARTDTPLQALTLLNDITYVEAARGIAQRVLKEGGSTAQSRIDLAFRLILDRHPALAETQILTKAIARQDAKYEANPKAAEELIRIGDLPPDSHVRPAELAAYVLAASTLLNMDETVTKR